MKEFNENDLRRIGVRSSTDFLRALAHGLGKFNDERFFGIIKSFINNNMNSFSERKLIKLLDIFKFMEHFQDQELKKRLEDQINRVRDKQSSESDGESEDRSFLYF